VTQIAIREAIPADAAGIAVIHEATVLAERGRGHYSDAQVDAWAQIRAPAELRGLMAKRRFFVACAAAGPVAYAQLDLETATLNSVYVHPDHQRSGLGRDLVQTAIAAARTAGLSRLEFDAALDSVSFYEALGFCPLGDLHEHEFRNGECMTCVRMGRGLDGDSGG